MNGSDFTGPLLSGGETLRSSTLQLGPLGVSVYVAERWYQRFVERTAGFHSPGEVQKPAVEIRLGMRNPDDGDDVNQLHKEVRAEIVKRRVPEISVGLRHTPRSTMRRLKRLSDPGHWQDGRWSILLRQGFELPVLALLEYRHGYAPVHAATVCGSGGAVLILGRNNAGKSTLACQLVTSLGLKLLADNFTPCDGRLAMGFPGSPRSKPGDSLPTLVATNRSLPLAGLVSIGVKLSAEPSVRAKQLGDYLQEKYDAHRGTGWVNALGGSEGASVRNSIRVGAELAHLPYLEYDRSDRMLGAVREFVGGLCGTD